MDKCTIWYTKLYKMIYLRKKNILGKWLIMYKMVYVKGYYVHINIQNRAKWYTLLYKLIYGSVQNKTAFLKIVQFGIQKCTMWSTWEKKYLVKMDDKCTKWYTFKAYMYKLIYKIVLNDIHFCSIWYHFLCNMIYKGV